MTSTNRLVSGCILTIGFILISGMAYGVPEPASTPFNPPPFHGTVLCQGMSHSPYMFVNDQCVFDVSEPDLLDATLARLAAVGCDGVIFYAYREPGGAHFAHDNPKIKPRATHRWSTNPKIFDLTAWRKLTDDQFALFLPVCEKYNLDAAYTTYIHRNMGERINMNLSKEVAKELAKRYGHSPAYRYYCPPVEAVPYRGIFNEDFEELARHAKSLDPDLKTMDYTLASYSYLTMEAVIAHAESPHVDVENVQLHHVLRREHFADMVELRGHTLRILGCAPMDKTVWIQPVAGFGPHKSGEQFSRLEFPDEGYTVRYGALLTMTPYGSNLDQYNWRLQGADFIHGLDRLWAWTEWCDMFIGMQRFAPYYAQTLNAARVGLLIPRYVPQGWRGVENIYKSLSKAHVPVRFFVHPENAEHLKVVVVTDIHGLSGPQAAFCREFVDTGGILIAVARPSLPPVPEDLTKRFGIPQESSQIRPELRQLLGLDIDQISAGQSSKSRNESGTGTSSPQIIFQNLGEGGGPLSIPASKIMEMSVPDNADVIAQWDDGSAGAYEVKRGMGKVIVLPKIDDILMTVMTAMVKPHEPVRVDGIPETHTVERWYAGDDQREHETFLFLATKPHERVRTTVLKVNDAEHRDFAQFISDEKTSNLRITHVDGGVALTLPTYQDWAVVVLGKHALPLLHVTPQRLETQVGAQPWIECRLENLSSRRITGTLRVIPPENWKVVEQSDMEFDLQPGAMKQLSVRIAVPQDAEHETYFVRFETLGLTQRAMVIPVDGKPRLLTRRTPPPPDEQEWREAPTGTIGEDWLSVEVGEEGDMAGKRPGVTINTSMAWGPVEEIDGKLCRRVSVRNPYTGMAGFRAQSVNRETDLQLRMTLLANEFAQITMDGGVFLGNIEPSSDWQTVEFRAPHEKFRTRSLGTRWHHDQSFFIDSPGVYIHRIEIRTAQN